MSNDILRNAIKSFLLFLLLLIIVVPVILPFLKSGYFPTHDGEWAVVRLADMFRTLRDFQIPPRYSGALNFGYGYPLFNFAYPFPYYFGLMFYLLFHNFVLGVKSVFVISTFLSALFMYLAAKKLWSSKLAGILSAVVYIYLPYRMVDLYVRGSIGESLSFALFPLIFYLSIKLFDNAFSRIIVILLSISIGILVTTHNIMTVLFIPLLVTFIFCRIISERRFDVLQSFFLCLLLGAGTSCFFWFPALFEKGYIALAKTAIADRNLYFVNLKQLIFPSWGYAPPTQNNGFSYQLGVGQIISVIVVFLITISSMIKTKMLLTPVKKYVFILSILYILYFLMMFSFTGIVWRSIPLLSEINYPWIMLSQLGFVSALLVGFLVTQEKIIKYLAIGIAILSVVVVFGYARPEKYNSNSDQYYISNEATTTSSDELMPLWVRDKPVSHYRDKVEVVSGEADIANIFSNSKMIKFDFNAKRDTVFQVNTIYYPGWKVFVNGVIQEIKYDNPKGLMQISVNKENSKAYFEFTETLPRVFADVVSIASLLILIFILLRPLLLFNNEE